jgi:hypothetical protein
VACDLTSRVSGSQLRIGDSVASEIIAKRPRRGGNPKFGTLRAAALLSCRFLALSYSRFAVLLCGAALFAVLLVRLPQLPRLPGTLRMLEPFRQLRLLCRSDASLIHC